jgi:uncharacterized cupin superfamily protein
MDKIMTKKMSLEDAKKLGIDDWSSWECEPSTFNWTYTQQEAAYIFEGEVVVTSKGKRKSITGGMFVSFPKGMDCIWDVKKTIKKAYTFNYELKK